MNTTIIAPKRKEKKEEDMYIDMKSRKKVLQSMHIRAVKYNLWCFVYDYN